MKIKTYIAGPIDANNYLLWDEQSNEAALIDCSDYIEELVNFVKAEKLNVKYILLTHGHFDHVLGINSMAYALDAKVGINEKDNVLITNINEFGNIFLGLPELDIPKIDFFIKDGDELSLGSEKIKVYHTPGHTEGGICYKVSNMLFCGDTLFRGSYGRTDLFGGNHSKIVNSIKNIIYKFDDKMELYPGHGSPSTIAYEKKHNEIKG